MCAYHLVQSFGGVNMNLSKEVSTIKGPGYDGILISNSSFCMHAGHYYFKRQMVEHTMLRVTFTGHITR